MRSTFVRFVSVLAAALTSACSTTSTNLAVDETQLSPALRTTFKVDGRRGNPRVLTYLALSGGGSRSAYFSSAVMLNLQTAFNDIDLLQEVDVISAVSGGAMAAAYYVGTQDRFIYDMPLFEDLKPLVAAKSVSAKIALEDPATGAVSCSGKLSEVELSDLARNSKASNESLTRLRELCETRSTSNLRFWDPATVRNRMGKNYLAPWFSRWFLPQNFVPYWFSSLDRSDIMAQVLASNLFSHGLLNREMRMSDLNPQRPFLLLNATSATQRETGSNVGKNDPPFGSVFTFTAEDFADRLGSRIDSYSVARAVMGSSAFPVVFQNMTLMDLRKDHPPHCPQIAVVDEPCSEQRYFHIFDGGNSDNLGLLSVKRSIFELFANDQLARAYDAIVVILVDSITQPKGADRFSPDPRSFFSLLADLNVTDAVDALLKGNHDKIMREFKDGPLSWSDDCLPESRNLPWKLCERLSPMRERRAEISQRLIFLHIGFEDVAKVPNVNDEERLLEERANRISTSFSLKEENAAVLDRIAALVVAGNNECLQKLRLVYLQAHPTAASVDDAKQACKESVPALKPAPTQETAMSGSR